MTMTEVGNVYGEALYGLCAEEGISEQVLSELSVLETSFSQEPEYIRLLNSPALTKAERCNILDASFRGRVQPYLLNYLKILTEKGYMHHFSDCCNVYRACYNNDHNILSVTATTAQPLTKTQAKQLSQKLGVLTGKTVQLRNRIDEKVIGGVLLDYDGRRLDDTIANRMNSIRNLLKNTVL